MKAILNNGSFNIQVLINIDSFDYLDGTLLVFQDKQLKAKINGFRELVKNLESSEVTEYELEIAIFEMNLHKHDMAHFGITGGFMWTFDSLEIVQTKGVA